MFKAILQQLRHLLRPSAPAIVWSGRVRLDNTFGHFYLEDNQGQWYPLQYQADGPTYRISYDGVSFQPFDVNTHALFTSWYETAIVHQSSLHRFFSARRAFLSFILQCVNIQEGVTQDETLLFPYTSHTFVDDYAITTANSVTSGTVHRYHLSVNSPSCQTDIHATLSLFLLVDAGYFDTWSTALQLQHRVSLLNRFIQRTYLPLETLTHSVLDEQNFLLHPQSEQVFQQYETLHAFGMPIDPLTLIRTYNQAPTSEETLYL